jgi:hypothetical protein
MRRLALTIHFSNATQKQLINVKKYRAEKGTNKDVCD